MKLILTNTEHKGAECIIEELGGNLAVNYITPAEDIWVYDGPAHGAAATQLKADIKRAGWKVKEWT